MLPQPFPTRPEAKLLRRLTTRGVVLCLMLASGAELLAQSASVASLAQAETRRRAMLVNSTNDDINQGYQLIQEGKAEQALQIFTAAYEALPNVPMVQESRMAARNGYVVAGCMHAQELMAKGRQKEAAALLDKLLSPEVAPKDARALALQRRFADPDRWPPALTKEHIENVGKVKTLLLKANSFRELSDLDQAIKTYQEVLLVDPYNSAARRGLEQAEQEKQRYYKAAYDHNRAKMLGAVDRAWEDPVPLTALDVSAMFGASAASTKYSQSGRESITQKLRTLIFPQVEFAGATLPEVAELLRVRSRDLDPQGVGVSFVLNVPQDAREKPISLNLSNVPMEEVLRYVSESCGVAYKVEDHAVIFVSISERDNAITTRSFRVPPDFIQNAPAGDQAAAAPLDPFGAQTPAGGGLVIRRMGAKEFLEARGVTFPEGTSANFNSATSTLTVRNTLTNMEMVELFVEQASKSAPKMAVITVRMLEVNQENLDELGFDWLLGGVGTNGNNLFLGGGSAGNGNAYSAANYPFQTTAQTAAITNIIGVPNLVPPFNPPLVPGPVGVVFPSLPVTGAFGGPLPPGIASTLTGQTAGGAAPIPFAGGPITSGLRSGSYATGTNSLDSLLSTGSANGTASVAPGVLSVAGVFTDPQFQTVVRALAQKKGIDINASPSVTTKNGLKATVEITREFIYPTEFDPPQLPQGAPPNRIVAAGATAVPDIATPTTPTAFDMKKTGVVLEVEPVISEDGRSVELTITPELTEFEGFVNYGSPIFFPASQSVLPIQFSNIIGFLAPPAPPFTPVITTANTGYIPIASPEQLITENKILQPIFKTQRVTTAVKIWDGATVVLGGAKVQQHTRVNDKIPVLGDLPFVGRFFQSNVAKTQTKNVIIFVTVDVVDPSGKKINRDTAAVTQ